MPLDKFLSNSLCHVLDGAIHVLDHFTDSRFGDRDARDLIQKAGSPVLPEKLKPKKTPEKIATKPYIPHGYRKEDLVKTSSGQALAPKPSEPDFATRLIQENGSFYVANFSAQQVDVNTSENDQQPTAAVDVNYGGRTVNDMINMGSGPVLQHLTM